MQWLLMFVLGLGVATSRAATLAETCAAAKVKAAGLEVYAKAKCHQKALRTGGTVDEACLTKAEQKFAAAFTRAEAAGGCAVTGDAPVVEAAVDACLASFAGAIAGDARCAAAKMKAVGKKTYAKAKCQRAAFLAGTMTADALCLDKAETKFTTAIAKADGRGTCTDTASALEALVDVGLQSLVPTTTSTSTSTSTTTTTLFPPCSNPSPGQPCGIVGSGGSCLLQCLPFSWVCVQGYQVPEPLCATDQDCAAYPGTHCILVETFVGGCVPICAAPAADDYPCVTSGAPACGGECPAGSVCGQASGGNVCECAALDHTCFISDAPACGGTCPSGEICGQHSGGDFCECVSPERTCVISEAPACGGTCPSGLVCGPYLGGNSCECVNANNTCSIAQAPTCGGTCPIGWVCSTGGTACMCVCDPALPCPFATKWGSPGSGNGQFAGLGGIAVDGSGNVFVADTGNDRIQKFDNNGTFLLAWGSAGSGDGQFDEPYSVAVDASGNVFVADLRNNRIQKFDNNGTFLLAWGSAGSANGQFGLPAQIAVDGNGSVFVADLGNLRIQKFDNTGSFLLTWGSAGSGDGQFVNAFFGIAVDGVGNVFVADNHRLQKFTNTGLFTTKWGSGSSSLAVDGGGNVYEANLFSSRIVEWDNSGNLLAIWGCPGTGDGQFHGVRGVAVDANSNLFVADDRIQKFACTM